MKNTVEVSIIILNWNGFKYTKKCLDHLLKITNTNYKIIVIDNGSATDDYEQLMKAYHDQAMIIQCKENKGFTGGVNYGIKIAKKMYNPDFYLLLNNDTVVEKNFLTELLRTARAKKNIGIVSPIIYNIDNKEDILYSGGQINWLFARPIHKKDRIADTKIATFVTGCCFLIKKDLLNKIGHFDDKFFAYFEDTAFCLQAIKAGFTCVVEPRAIIYHKESASLGKKSETFTYLFSRNRILFINNYTHSFYRFYFFIFNFLKLLAVETYFLYTKQDKRAMAFLKGFIDGNRGIGGKPKI